jgi:flagellar basal body-associated protein FliL
MTALLVLVLVTIVSLAVAGVLAMYVRQLTRAERERSEANAAALADMIGPAHLDTAADVDLAPDSPASSPAMFSATEPVVASSRLFLIPTIGLFVVIAALSGIYAWNRPSRQTVAAAEASSAPLELVALRHQRRGDVMTISGLVRNPRGGRTIQSLSAVALTFDKQGTFLATGRAPLDFPLLQPGDESPFTIAVPNSPGIGRYRVTFRTESGIVPHVDRRADSQVAMQ